MCDAETIMGPLTTVMTHGGPAQRATARELMDLLTADPADSGALGAARELIDAYLHDPHLERN